MREGHHRLPERCAMAIASVVVRYPWGVVLIAALFAAIGVLVGLNTIKLDADTNNLIAEDRPYITTFREWMEEFGDLEYIYVVVDTSSSSTKEGEAAVRLLVERFNDIPELPAVNGFITPEEQWRLATRAMPEDELARLLLAADALPLLGSPRSAGELLTIALKWLDPSSQQSIPRTASGVLLLESITGLGLSQPQPTEYLATPDGQLLFVEIMPDKDYGTLAAIAQPLARINQVIDEVVALHPTLQIGVTGKPVLQAEEMATSDRDMTQAAILATILITALFMVVFRGLRRPILALIAFAFAFAWTYGAAGIIVGRLNLLSMVFMIVLVGVGIDFGIHIVARYAEACRTSPPLQAVRLAIRTAGRGNLFGACTSAGVFFLALATPFGGLRELGVIAGIGLLFCALAMCTVLPALLLITEGSNPAPQTTAPLLSKGSDTEKTERHPLPIILVALLATGILAVTAVRSIRFEDNLLELQADGLESVEWEHRIMEHDQSASWFAAVQADDLEDVAKITTRSRQFPEIGVTRSVLDLISIPTPERTRLREAFGRAFETNFQDIEANTAITPHQLRQGRQHLEALRAVAAQDIEPISDRLDHLARQLDDPSSRDAAIKQMTAARTDARNAVQWMRKGNADTLREALPQALRASLMSPTGRFQVLLSPAKDVWEYEPMAAFIAAVRNVDPSATGVPITHYESINDMHTAFILMATCAFILVALIVWLDFQSLTDTIVIVATLAVGLFWTIGMMAFVGVSLNLANFFAIPILLGIGVDSGIHMLHRAKEHPEGNTGYGATRRAVILTASSTMIGFGMLCLAYHRGLQSLGIVMVLGSLSILLATLYILPALYNALDRSTRNRIKTIPQ